MSPIFLNPLLRPQVLCPPPTLPCPTGSPWQSFPPCPNQPKPTARMLTGVDVTNCLEGTPIKVHIEKAPLASPTLPLLSRTPKGRPRLLPRVTPPPLEGLLLNSHPTVPRTSPFHPWSTEAESLGILLPRSSEPPRNSETTTSPTLRDTSPSDDMNEHLVIFPGLCHIWVIPLAQKEHDPPTSSETLTSLLELLTLLTVRKPSPTLT